MQLLSDRQHNIITLARTLGRVGVDDLSARFDVTPQTIRRDLNELCERRVLTRTHGGAVVSSCVENLSYDARRFIAAAEKKAIGIATAALSPSKSSPFINTGTTAEEVAAALAKHDAPLAITNNLNVAMTLYRRPSVEVIVAGAPARCSDGPVAGSAAVDLIGRFKVDTPGTGPHEDESLLDDDAVEVNVSRAIIEYARRVLLVCDRTKLERAAPVRIGHISQIHRLDSAALRQVCKVHGVNIIETDAGAPIEQPTGYVPPPSLASR